MSKPSKKSPAAKAIKKDSVKLFCAPKKWKRNPPVRYASMFRTSAAAWLNMNLLGKSRVKKLVASHTDAIIER